MFQTWRQESQTKVVEPGDLDELLKDVRREGKSIVTINGSFDLLHAGHLHILYEASRQGDILIVALNTDTSIQAYKGSSRPIIPLEYRIEMMAALGFVDHVTWFEEDNPCSLLEIIRPDVHCNGAEYGEDCVEAEAVKRHGGRIHVINLVPGLSTSNIISKIHDICD